jgi:hypothetical protein
MISQLFEDLIGKHKLWKSEVERAFDEFDDQEKQLIAKFCIRAWGSLYYLDYPSLKQGGSASYFEELFNDILQNPNFVNFADGASDDDWYDYDEVAESIAETFPGAIFDAAFSYAMRPLKKDLKIYRAAPEENMDEMRDSWLSVSTSPDMSAYRGGDGSIPVYAAVLPKGTKVVNTNGWADRDELIIWAPDAEWTKLEN